MKPPSGSAGARIIPAQLFNEFLAPVNDLVAFLDPSFRREPLSSLAGGFVERVNLHSFSWLPYVLHSFGGCVYRPVVQTVHHRLDLLCEEEFPVIDLARVPNEHRNRHFLRRTGNREQP